MFSCLSQNTRAKSITSDSAANDKDNREIVYDRLHSRCTNHDVYLLIFIAERNSVEIEAVASIVTLSSLMNTHDAP